MLLAAAETAQSVPWWGTGAFTLAGGIVGAFIVQAFNVYNNRRKFREEKLEKDQALSRESLLDFLASAHTLLWNWDDNLLRAQFYANHLRIQLTLQGELREAAQLYFEAFTELMVTGGTSKNEEGERPLVRKLADSEWTLLDLARLKHEQLGLPKPS